MPLDPLHPDGRTIDLAVSRIKADPGKRRGVLVVNPGGPGGSGLDYPLALRPLLGDVAKQYDLIGFDPRFVGRSAPANCGEVRLADVFRSSLDRADFVESAHRARAFVRTCPEGLQHASIRNVARDLDVVRKALGEEKLNYYGVSWGADLGVVYSQLFEGNVDRMVVDSVTDVEGSEYHHLATGERAEAAFDEWAAWAAWRDDKYHLGGSGQEIRAAVSRLMKRDLTIAGHKVDSAVLPWVLQSALGDENDRDLMARNVSTLLRNTPPTPELTGWLDQYYGRAPVYSQFIAASIAFTCNDTGWPTSPAAYWRDVQRTRSTQPLFATTFLPCAYWTQHTTEPPLAISNNTPLLIVQAERDNIPLHSARTLHTKLPNSTLHTVDRRTHGVYDERIPAMVKTVNDYLGRR
ncbi:alpha/beta fold hydrolase [Kribbella lupini]|uniref:alpha/beta fold hydrolase n=1 Tax=Kribbella lupini TaxID=291602 RepID=UPI0031CDD4C0